MRPTSRLARSERRQGAGALLAISVIGVVVLSILVLTQGFLQGAVSQADAVLAGRRAEYLADGALAEALYRLQTERNTGYSNLFLAGGSTSIQPVTAQGLAADGIDVGEVDVTVASSQDIQGDGRGYAGVVALGASSWVPRRIARVLGTGVTRTVVASHEYRAVQQGPPLPFAEWPLYARRLRDLPEVERWYVEEVQEEWARVREAAAREVERDAADVVSAFAPYQTFAGKVHDYVQSWMEWPGQLPAVLGTWSLSPSVDAVWYLNVAGVPAGHLDLDIHQVRLKLDAPGDAYTTVDIPGPFNWVDWINGRPEIPPARGVLEDSVRSAVEQAIATFYHEALSANAFLVRAAELRDADTAGFPARVGAGPGQYTLPPLVWRDFREDGADLLSPAHFEESPLESDSLHLEPPNADLLVRPLFPDSPIRMIRGAGFPLDFDGPRWDAALLDSPPLAELEEPFERFRLLWPEAFVDYMVAWEEELSRYEELIRLQTSADEALARPDYWSAFAAYAFPDAGTMLSYIQERWGVAGAVYRFPGGDVPTGGLAGDATFVAEGDLGVSGASAGAKTFVSGGRLSVQGTVRGTLLALEHPVSFNGATVEGVVAAGGVKAIGPSELDPFTIVHDPFADAGVTVSISEYPVTVAVSRGI